MEPSDKKTVGRCDFCGFYTLVITVDIRMESSVCVCVSFLSKSNLSCGMPQRLCRSQDYFGRQLSSPLVLKTGPHCFCHAGLFTPGLLAKKIREFPVLDSHFFVRILG